ncbi:MAG: alanine racemase [Bryobacterales bacterium]|nr:alanine racemase [Bryobacterales bacterium]
MSAPHRSWIEVSLGTIAANFRAVRQLVNPDVEVCPVVKADAYRHGAVEVSRRLEREGARWLAVSSLQEGIALRNSGARSRILVMADFLPAAREEFFRFNLTPVIHSLDDLAALDRLAASKGISFPYHLKIDSGMGRLGVLAPGEQIVDAVCGARSAVLEGLMTHFASAADYISTQTDEQIETFEGVYAKLAACTAPPPLVHMSSTIAVAYGRRQAWRTMVRPGHALYGYVSPVRVRSNDTPPVKELAVEPALSWKAALLLVKDVPAGARIGYGGMYRTETPIRIGIVAAGYADGIPHRLSNKGRFIADGQWAPILGAVSMDVTTIDLSASPHLRPGDPVTLLGSEGDLRQDAQQMARAAGTISYSLLCGIGARVPRIFVD